MRLHLSGFGDTRRSGPPDWPVPTGRPRVLVEAADGAMQVAVKHILDGAGYEVGVCGGPEALRGGVCPLVDEGRCPLAEGADAILNTLRLNTADSRAVLAAVRGRLPATPVIVEIPKPQLAVHGDELAGCRVALFPILPEEVREQVHAALGDA